MRAALVFLALSLAGPALAQEGDGALDVRTVNGVRVWRPKPSPPAATRQTAPAPTTVVVINNLPAPEASSGEIVGLPIGAPFFHRPVRGPFFPHPDMRPPHFQPRIGVQFPNPGRRF